MEIFIEYKEDEPDWYANALRSYNNEILNFIENAFSDKQQIV